MYAIHTVIIIMFHISCIDLQALGGTELNSEEPEENGVCTCMQYMQLQ